MTSTTNQEGTMSTTTSIVICDCGCGESVTLSFPGGFSGTQCQLSSCSVRRAAGISSINLRRSQALNFQSPSQFGLAHHDGLVVLG